MPTAKIPLVGSFNTRGIDGDASLVLNEDQRFLNTTFNVVQNPVTGKSTVYAERRPGWAVDSQVSSGLASTGLIKPLDFNAALSAFGETNSAIYIGTNNVGNITGRALHFTETLISASSYVVLKSSDGTGWYYPDGAKDILAYTGATSSGSLTISTIAEDMSGIYQGQLITGNSVGTAARVSTINTATSTITVTVASSASSTSVALTKEPIAKMLSANFLTTGVYRSAFAAMDGYLFYSTDDGYVNNSDLNSAIVYSANARLAVQQSPDPSVAVAVQNNALLVLGTNSKEVFQNAGLASGSPLQRIAQAAERIGCIDQRSLTMIEDDIYFVSTPYEGDVGVYRIRGLKAQRISTPNVDRIIGTAATNGAIYASSYRQGGYPYASFTVSMAQDGPASNFLLESGDALLLESGDNLLLEDTPAQTASFVRQLVYNITLNLWSEWDCDEATFIDSVGSGTNNQLLATSRFVTGGKIYKIDPMTSGEVYQDDGSTYTMEIRTSRINHGTSKVKFIDEIRLICDQQTTGTASLSYSDDDYKTWSTARDFDLSVQEPKLTRLGSYSGGRAYKLTHASNAPFRAEAIEIDYRVGTR